MLCMRGALTNLWLTFFRLPTQRTVQPTKGSVVAVANSGASKGGMMSPQMSENRSARNNRANKSPSSGRATHLVTLLLTVLHAE